jgi:hypothetical protein
LRLSKLLLLELLPLLLLLLALLLLLSLLLLSLQTDSKKESLYLDTENDFLALDLAA